MSFKCLLAKRSNLKMSLWVLGELFFPNAFDILEPAMNLLLRKKKKKKQSAD